MGLFSKRQREPIAHPAAERVIYVEAARPAVAGRLDAYSGLSSPKHAVERSIDVSSSGSWTAVRLPAIVHPWQLHNLAYWLLDGTSQMVATASACADHPAYWLVDDPELPDALCGWDEQGGGWTVWVPCNMINRGDDVPVARAISMPSGFHEWAPYPVLLEDPGHEMNPANESTAKRSQLAAADDLLGTMVWGD